MRRSNPRRNRRPERRLDPCTPHTLLRLPTALLAAGFTFATVAPGAAAEDRAEIPFKVARIIFEGNASACDLGIQIQFDTEGIVSGTIRDPDDRSIYEVRAKRGIRQIGGQTEGFLEGVEPQIEELIDAIGCERDEEVDVITLDDLRKAFPAGDYAFEGRMADGTELRDQATLTYDIPDGPVLGAPDGADDVNPARVVIRWEPVTTTIPGLEPAGPVNIVGYQVIVSEDGLGEAPPEYNIVLPACGAAPLPRCRVTVSPQFFKPGTAYVYEVLAIEEGGNQTITEGSFETQ